MNSFSISPDRVFTLIVAKPGLNCNRLAAELDVPTGMIRFALAELKSSGRIRSEGKTQGTRYYSASDR